MYNTHLPPPISALRRSVYLPKAATSVRDRKLQSGSHLADGLGRWVSFVVVTNIWPLIAPSLKPNHSWMQKRMALERLHYRAAPSVTAWRSVRICPPLRLSRLWRPDMEGGERRADSASQMLQHELKAPSRHGAVVWSTVGLYAEAAAPVFR